MKFTYFLIFLYSLISTGCTTQRQIPVSQKQFFTPENWKEPITRTSSPKTPGLSKTVVTVPDQTEPVPAVPAQVLPGHSVSKNQEITKLVPGEQMAGYASWYGPGFHGKKTANGEKYNQNMMTAAHKILPMNTQVQVTNLENNRSVMVRINDRGPYKKNRIIDVTRKAAEELDFKDQGTTRVSLKVIRYPKNFDPSNGLTPYKQSVIQIAVFKNRQRANIFKDQLSGRYQRIPFLIDQQVEGMYSVIAGPYEDKDKARKTGAKLKADGIDNFVRSYRK